MQRWGSVLEFVDLSDCIEDNETIYIVNKISKNRTRWLYI